MRPTRRETLKGGAGLGVLAAMSGACAPKEAKSAAEGGGAGSGSGSGDLASIDAVATAALIKSGEITPGEAVNAAIARAEAVEPAINAIVVETFDAARARAASAVDGPFAGVPMFTKDLLDVKGVPSGYGSRSFNGFTPASQYPFADDLEEVGFISLGKSTTPEFGLTATTEPVSSGVTRNPWNPAHSSGGSSGGAAALAAAGVVPLAHASDGGGSIRIPASCCGLVGLKVSRDRYRSARDESITPVRISVQGAETRTVRDTAAFLAALEMQAGEGPLAPVGMVTGPGKRRLVIKYFKNSGTDAPVDPEVAAAVDQAAATCAELGHNVEEISLPYDTSFGDAFFLYWAGIANSIITTWEKQAGRAATEAEFEPFTFGLQGYYRERAGAMNAAVLQLISFGKAYREGFGGADILMSPTLAKPPVPIGYLGKETPFDEAVQRLFDYAQYTSLANVSGAASLSLPLGMSSDGLPIGVLFNGQTGDERLLLELAYELEEAAPWAGRKPQIFAG